MLIAAQLAEFLTTPELWAKAVAQNGRRLRQVPENFVTSDLCRIAVVQNGLTLEHVPECFKTVEICALAVKQNGFALCHVPEHLKTAELCTLAVAQNGYILRYVTVHRKTVELCTIAMLDDWRAIDAVPKYLRTDLEKLIGKAIATYTFTIYRRPNGLYQASSKKNLTLEQALVHWGPPRTDPRAKIFYEALLREKEIQQ
jgi:hypothetical protein